MRILDSITKNKTLNKKGLHDLLNSILKEVEGSKGDMHLATIFELVSDKLKQHNINSIVCIINEKRNEVVVRHVNFPGNFREIFTTKNIKEISFTKFVHYQKAIKNRRSLFIHNRLSQYKKIFPKAKYILPENIEMNSIILPLILRNEIIGTIEILSSNLEKEDLLILDDFVKKLVISITNNILFHEIRESEKRYRELFQNSSDGLIFFDIKEKRFKESNKMMTKISEYTSDELKQINYLNLFAQQDKKRVEEKISYAKNSKQLVNFFCRIITKYKKIKFVNCEIYSNTYNDEITFNFLDITEKRKTEEALKDSEEKYRNLVDNAVDGVLILDTNTKITFINKAIANILEGNKEDIINKSFKGFIFEDDLAVVSGRYNDRIKGKAIISNYDFRVKTLKS